MQSFFNRSKRVFIVSLRYLPPTRWWKFLKICGHRLYVACFFRHEQLVTAGSGQVTFHIQVKPGQGIVDNTVWQHHQWEPNITRLLATLLKPDSVFVDIGANIGYHTLTAAALVPQGRVFAFEPLARIHNQLQTSVDTNHFTNVTLFQYACSDVAKKQTLYTNVHNVGGTSALAPEHFDTMEEIECRTLDSVLANEPRIDVMKIDVEGFELEVLQGSEGILQKFHPTIILEFSSGIYDQRAASMSQDIWDLLKKYHYNITIVDSGVVVETLEMLLAQRTKYSNYIDIVCT